MKTAPEHHPLPRNQDTGGGNNDLLLSVVKHLLKDLRKVVALIQSVSDTLQDFCLDLVRVAEKYDVQSSPTE